MAEINWTVEAEQWLKDIHNYIAQDKPDAAIRVVEGIYEKAQLLRQFPEIGYRYDDILINIFVFCFMVIIENCISHKT